MGQKLLLNNVERDTCARFVRVKTSPSVSWIFIYITASLFCIPSIFFDDFSNSSRSRRWFFSFCEYFPCFINNYLPFFIYARNTLL